MLVVTMKEIVAELLEELSSFPGREEGVRKVMRFGIIKPVFYRFSIFSHGKRIAWLLASIAPLIESAHATLDLMSTEAQVTKYLDRFDALGETLHDLYAGNIRMSHDIFTEYGLIPCPFVFYKNRLPKMMDEMKALHSLRGKHTFFESPEQKSWKEIVPTFVPHTQESLTLPTGHPQYDAWKEVILAWGDEEEIRNLYTQRKFS